MAWGGSGDRTWRRGPVGGALLAAGAILGVSAWRGGIDPAAALAGIAAVLVCALWPRRRADADGSAPDGSGALTSSSSATIFPDPVILLDRRGIVVEANPEARRLLPGLQDRFPLSFALRAPQVLDAVTAVLASGEAARVEYGGRGPGEPVHEVRLRSWAAEAGQGEPVVALFFRDLSDERRTETMRVDFVANVSHELRTPLASLVGFIDTLRGPAREDPTARERFLDIMHAQAGRMTRLIDDLLRLSQVERKEHLAPAEPIDLAETTAHMVEIMAPLARARATSIAITGADSPAMMLGDRDELLRLVENLVENAIKYGREGGSVRVAIGRAEPGLVTLSVADDGPGIAGEHIPRLTERFYRVDVAESRAKGGTGLGLAIVKHIVGRHRGRLTIASERGQGTRIDIRFPAVAVALSD